MLTRYRHGKRSDRKDESFSLSQEVLAVFFNSDFSPHSSEVVLGTDGKICVAMVSLSAKDTEEKLSLHYWSLECTLRRCLIL